MLVFSLVPSTINYILTSTVRSNNVFCSYIFAWSCLYLVIWIIYRLAGQLGSHTHTHTHSQLNKYTISVNLIIDNLWLWSYDYYHSHFTFYINKNGTTKNHIVDTCVLMSICSTNQIKKKRMAWYSTNSTHKNCITDHIIVSIAISDRLISNLSILVRKLIFIWGRQVNSHW